VTHNPASAAPTPVAVPDVVRTRALAALGTVPIVVVAIDQGVKQAALTHLTGSTPVRLLGGLIWLNLTRNSGAAFSIGTSVTFLFPILAVAMIAGIIYLSRSLGSLPWAISFGLVVGGAMGNVIDRLFRPPGVLRGQVIDMIALVDSTGRSFPPWAIFNIADASLFCGVVLAVILELSGRRRDGSRRVIPPHSPQAGA
jgi:signal peptidase II